MAAIGAERSRMQGFPRRAAIVCLAILGGCILAGCPTQNRTSLLHPRCATVDPFQECPVRLSEYRSVQERIGGQDGTLALAVAISGGGHRAAP